MRTGTHGRSGNAVLGCAKRIGWRPQLIIQVGVGLLCREVEIFHEEWPFVEMIGFEPEPKSFAELESTYPGRLIHAAVGERSQEQIPFYIKQGHQGGSSLLQASENKSALKIVHVPMVDLDSVFSEITKTTDIPVDRMLGMLARWRILCLDKDILLWLDCEGTEWQALRGASRLLRRVGMVNVEMTGVPQAVGWCSPEDVHDELMVAGFYQTWTHTMQAKIGQYNTVYVCRELFQPRFCCCLAEIARWKRESNK